MKTSTKLIIAEATVGAVVAGVLIAQHFSHVDKENHSVQIIGGTEQPSELPDFDQVIFVYCRSGRRSKEASSKLAALGYTNIYEFGGILDWDGEIEK